MRLVCLIALLLAPVSGRAADPSALWKIVNGQCVPHEETEHSPSPCAKVDIADGVEKGFVVLKDRNGIAQFLLIPTARISGIDDPAILAPGVLVGAHPGRPAPPRSGGPTIPRRQIAWLPGSRSQGRHGELHHRPRSIL